jgi:hypothetical protein
MVRPKVQSSRQHRSVKTENEKNALGVFHHQSSSVYFEEKIAVLVWKMNHIFNTASKSINVQRDNVGTLGEGRTCKHSTGLQKHLF